MSVPILICDCGVRLRAPGATPGRVGRCPKCGGTLKFPEEPAPVKPAFETEPNAVGYFIEPKNPSSSAPAVGESVASERRPRARKKQPKPRSTGADGLLPKPEQPESWWLPSTLYPLRGAECMGLMALLGTAFWILTVLVPAYCFTLISDADSLGAMPMGYLVALITSLPVVLIIPFAIFYLLQYLGRVLVSSALGETIPPRSPDRNFDGFLSGLSPWFVWAMMGLTVSLLPFVSYSLTQGGDLTANPIVPLALLAIGIPYALMALMMSFLHDDGMAAKPIAVTGAVLRLFGSFLGTCLIVEAAIGLGVALFALIFLLRANHFWLFLFACLAGWISLIWIMIVVMRILGMYYYRHKAILKWHRERPRWGVAWKL